MADEVIPFRLAVPEIELDNLRARLRATRWPERETVEDDSQGVSLADLEKGYARTGRTATTGGSSKPS
jgi:hypothetical protein